MGAMRCMSLTTSPGMFPTHLDSASMFTGLITWSVDFSVLKHVTRLCLKDRSDESFFILLFFPLRLFVGLLVCWLVGWLFHVPTTCLCISGMDLLRQVYMLPHQDRNCRSNFPSDPVRIY